MRFKALLLEHCYGQPPPGWKRLLRPLIIVATFGSPLSEHVPDDTMICRLRKLAEDFPGKRLFAMMSQQLKFKG